MSNKIYRIDLPEDIEIVCALVKIYKKALKIHGYEVINDFAMEKRGTVLIVEGVKKKEV